jgi:hypothetical protein
MLENAFGQTPFWLPPALVATMCWADLQHLPSRGWMRISIVLITMSLLLLSVEEAEQAVVVALTWNRRSTTSLTDFVRQNIPSGSSVYGPIGGFFYPVELAGSQYLYSFEHTTPGLYSGSQTPIGEKLDQRICSRPTYAIWVKPNSVLYPPQQIMPDALHQRLGEKMAELDQPILAGWKVLLLQRVGPVGRKYGFPDAVIYSLGRQHCGKD